MKGRLLVKSSSTSGFGGMAVPIDRRDRIYGYAGFSLIELMVVVGIIAILAAIAYPIYMQYITRTNRTAAEGCLSEYANYMERYYTTNLQYNETSAGVANPVLTTSMPLDCSGAAQTGANYKYSVPTLSASAYTIQATPINAQLARDTQCGTLTLDQTGARGILGGTSTAAACW